MGEYEKADPMNPDTFNEHNSFWTGSGIRSTFNHISDDKWNKAFPKTNPLQITLKLHQWIRIQIRYAWNLNITLIMPLGQWLEL